MHNDEPTWVTSAEAIRQLLDRRIPHEAWVTTSNMPPVNDTLHEQSDANADLSMGYAVRTGMCNDPHKSG